MNAPVRYHVIVKNEDTFNPADNFIIKSYSFKGAYDQYKNIINRIIKKMPDVRNVRISISASSTSTGKFIREYDYTV